MHGKKRWWSLRSVFSIGISGNEDAEEEKHCGGYLELNTQADGSTCVGIYVPKAKVQALLSFIIFLVVFHAILRLPVRKPQHEMFALASMSKPSTASCLPIAVSPGSKLSRGDTC